MSRSLVNAAIICDAIRRFTWFLMPMNSRDLELIVTNPITRMLSYIKAAMRDLVRELDLLSYETMGRLTPPSHSRFGVCPTELLVQSRHLRWWGLLRWCEGVSLQVAPRVLVSRGGQGGACDSGGAIRLRLKGWDARGEG